MEQAKAAIQQFTSKSGQKDTTVHEHVKPAVTHEHVTPTRHENVTTAIDREVHQEHHHTSIQPIQDREVLPEKHTHNIVPVEHKEEVHGDPNLIKERLAAEAAQFKNVSETGQTQHTKSVQPIVGGEHVHHHVHEYVQPVIQKETIQPTVVHTTIPVHEVHHNEPKHHAASALPAVSLAEWKKSGGSLNGREERTDRFMGEPGTETSEQHARHGGIHHHGISDSVSPSMSATSKSGTSTSTSRGVDSTKKQYAGPEAAAVGAVGTGMATMSGNARNNGTIENTSTKMTGTTGATGRVDPRVDSPISPASAGTRSSTYSDGATSAGTDRTSMSNSRESKFADTHLGSKMDEGTKPVTGYGTGKNTGTVYSKDVLGTETSTEKRKPSLLQKLNPLKDADGDGRKGIMT